MRIEKTELWIRGQKPFQQTDARAIRGYFGRLFENISAFHGHIGDQFIYRHPLIQYKVIDGSAVLVGLQGGAYLLKGVPPLESINLRGEAVPVIDQEQITEAVEFGISDASCHYRFLTPWIALNSDNYVSYRETCHDALAVRTLLQHILIGNVLSLSKALGYVVDSTLEATVTPTSTESVVTKVGMHLLGFNGEFTANFVLPGRWGVGKFSSRGYGTTQMMREA